MFCAAIAEIVESIVDGTRNKKVMIFSTMPTAAAISTPRLFAIIVMNRNDTWMNPSCAAIGAPMLKSPLNAV